MENKPSQGKAGPSRKSDVIILTPDELAKLGLITEIKQISTENVNTKNEAKGNDMVEKLKAKFNKAIRKELKSTDKNCSPQIKISNKTSRKVDITKNSNTKLIPAEKEKYVKKKSNDNKSQTLSIKYNINQEKNQINTNRQSSSKDNEKTNEEFKKILTSGLSKKLKEFNDPMKYDISKQKLDNTSQKVDKIASSANTPFKNTKNLNANKCVKQIKSNNSPNIEKKINITAITSVRLSDGELKKLVSNTNRHNVGKKLFFSGNSVTKLDNKKLDTNFDSRQKYLPQDNNQADGGNLIVKIQDDEILEKIPLNDEKINNSNDDPDFGGISSAMITNMDNKKLETNFNSCEKQNNNDQVDSGNLIIKNIEDSEISECSEKILFTDEKINSANEYPEFVGASSTMITDLDNEKLERNFDSREKQNNKDQVDSGNLIIKNIENNKISECSEKILFTDEKINSANEYPEFVGASSTMITDLDNEKLEKNFDSREKQNNKDQVDSGNLIIKNIENNKISECSEKILLNDEKINSANEDSEFVGTSSTMIMNLDNKKLETNFNSCEKQNNDQVDSGNLKIKNIEDSAISECSEKILFTDEEINSANEYPEVVGVTPTMISENQKYLMNSSVEDINKKIVCTKESSEIDIKQICPPIVNKSDDINISTVTEENEQSRIAMDNSLSQDIKKSKPSAVGSTKDEIVGNLPKKRGRPKKILHNENVATKETNDFKDRENAESNVGTSPPKKRGRPKKISNIGVNNQSTPIVTTGTSDMNSSESVTSVADMLSTPIPKKRGRKKKSEQVAPPVVVPDVIEPVELDESRSGRKRKKVNYLELANELDDDDEPKRKQKFSIQRIEKIKIKREKKDEKGYLNRDKQEDLNQDKQEYLNKDKQEEFDSNDNSINCSQLDEAEASVKVDVSANETVESEDVSTVDNSENKNENKKCKYRKTGETIMMMNSIFAAAFKNNMMSQKGDDSNVSSEASSLNTTPVVARRTPGRKRKTVADITIDEDNMVACATCNEKVNNDVWAEHNRQEHNNLSWRIGEPELELDNGLVVAKILKAILREDNEIKCKICKNSFDQVTNFTNHMEKCSGILSSTNMVTCAICKTEMEKTKWPNHKRKQHNNLAWRTGDRPLDLSDKHLVVSILTALYKAKKPLYCYKCGESKKSVIGFLSHQSQCGEQQEAKIKCQFCDRKVLPVSMQSHVKFIHEKPQEKKEEHDSNYFDVDTDLALQKRKAAKMAMDVINKISGERMIQEYMEYFVEQLDFSEESFVKVLLNKELINNNTVKCKFSNCQYESDSVNSLIEHMNSCEEKPEQYYTCRKCLLISSSEEEMKEHLNNAHNIDIIHDEYDNAEDEMMEQYDIDMKRGSQHEKYKMDKNPQYKAKPTFILNLSRRPNQLFSGAYGYTLSFCERHYSTKDLYKTLRYDKSDWLLLKDDLIEQYLPQSAQSCDVVVRKINSKNLSNDEYSFKKFELFESQSDEGVVTIFCGGPVQAMAWMPTPYDSLECRQVLAVAPLNNFDKKYLINVNYDDQSLIQFWDFGILKNKEATVEPKLFFSLAHDFGPVWHLEWCPSGCFDTNPEDGDKMSRMGLIAVAGSNSAVYIYSIPHLKDEQMGMIYKIKPLLRLHLPLNEMSSLNREHFFTTKVSWSKASGHRYIAVGYTDGMVAMFDLDTTSNLMRGKDKDGCELVLPFRTFQAHIHTITVLDLIHLDDGKRWLLTGSFDRKVIVWDLTNDFKIVSKRQILSDGVWLTNWLAFISTADESSTRQSSVPTIVASYRNYMYEHVNLTTSSSTVNTISTSSWLNGIMYCSSLGEITAIFPTQLLFGLDYDKKLKSFIYSFGYTKLINKRPTSEKKLVKAKRKKSSQELNTSNEDNVLTETNSYEPITYQECSDKYGLVFCDVKMDSYKDFDKEDKKRTHEEPEISKADLYSIHAINKVAFNPNLQASLYYATGYQAGFVRVTYMKFLEKDTQIK